MATHNRHAWDTFHIKWLFMYVFENKSDNDWTTPTQSNFSKKIRLSNSWNLNVGGQRQSTWEVLTWSLVSYEGRLLASFKYTCDLIILTFWTEVEHMQRKWNLDAFDPYLNVEVNGELLGASVPPGTWLLDNAVLTSMQHH